MRVWVNGQLLIDQWNDHGAATHSGSISVVAGQRYPIVMEFYENYGAAVARLRWTSARIPLQPVPQSQLYPALITGTGTGLVATYFDNQDLTGITVTRIDPVINFDWSSGSPASGIGADTFSARWLGEVQPFVSETYTFTTISDDGIRVWVGDQLVIDHWTDHSASARSGTIALIGGQRYPLRIEYYENGGAAVAKLLWASPSTPSGIVPTSQLYPTGFYLRPKVAMTATAAAEGGASGSVTFTIPDPQSTDTIISYTIGGTATAGSDYVSAPLTGSVTIPANTVQAVVVVAAVDDTEVEGTETVTFTLVANPAYVVAMPSTVTVAITDNDQSVPLPVVSITATDPSAAESGSDIGRLTVNCAVVSSAPVTVRYTVGGTATSGEDYAPLSGSVIIAGGADSAQIDIVPIDDQVVESAETVIVTIDVDAAYVVGSPSSATVTITSEDVPVITAPTVTTTAVTGITQTGATSGGTVTADGGASVTARGICWSTSANPTTADTVMGSGTGTGAFTATLSGLTASTTYHVRAYATNSAGTAYGADVTFNTSATLTAPTVTTAAVTGVTGTDATSGGTVTADGGSSVSDRGVCWSTSANPTVANSTTSNGTGLGTFSSTLSGLTAGTTYHVRAYATNGVGTSYGADLTFTTTSVLTEPTVTTTAVTGITTTGAASGGTVTADGGAAVIARGVCWSTSANPTTANFSTINGTGTGAFTSSLTGLSASTTYHVRAYATNSVGTAYGTDVTFTTSAVLTTPTVTTAVVTGITGTGATSGGTVTADGGSAVTLRGVCWSTSANPTTANSTTSNGAGIGAFTSAVTGLVPGTAYHVRAFATNSVGTAYGTDLTFTTPTIPSVTTATVTGITTTGATSGGTVTADGGATVTARGICWSPSANPTVANSTTSNGTGTGTFISTLTGLTPGATYHVRAYATNSVGTAYGTDLSFVAQPLPTNAPPVITAVTATPTAVSGTSTVLAVTATDDGGAANLRYFWQVQPGSPYGATFSTNNSTAAQTVTATFTQPGNYVFQVTATDAGNLSASAQSATVVVAAVTALDVSPAVAHVGLNGWFYFTALISDQFGNQVNQADYPTWSVTGGGDIFDYYDQGLFVAGDIPGGPFTVTATWGGFTKQSTVYVGNRPVLGSVVASPEEVTGTVSNLSVDVVEPAAGSLSYHWQIIGPTGGVSLNVNHSTSAQSVTATFALPYDYYTFEVVATDAAGFSSEPVGANVVVRAIPTTLTISPTAPVVAIGTTRAFTAVLKDQFGQSMIPTPAPVWSVTGGGAISSAGLFTPTTVGSYQVQVTWGGKTATTPLTVVNATPIITKLTAVPDQFQLKVMQLFAEVTDDGGPANLSFSWTVETPAPGAVTFSANDSSVAYLSTASFVTPGTYQVRMTVTDVGGQSVTQTLSIPISDAPLPQPPTFSPPPGTYLATSQTVTLTATPAEAQIWYTVGTPSAPLPVDPQPGVPPAIRYLAPFTINAGVTIKAVAATSVGTLSQVASRVVKADYILINTTDSSSSSYPQYAASFPGDGIVMTSPFCAEFQINTKDMSFTMDGNGVAANEVRVIGEKLVYGNVPLSSNGPTLITTSYRSVTQPAPLVPTSTSRSVTWGLTDLNGKSAAANRVFIRRGDSLLLGHSGMTDPWTLDTGSQGTVAGDVGSRLPTHFPTAGNFVVRAIHHGGEVASLAVSVLDVPMNQAELIAAEVNFERPYDVTVTPGGWMDQVSFVPADTDVLAVSVNGDIYGQRTLKLKPLKRGLPMLLARLGNATGPIIVAKEVTEFEIENAESMGLMVGTGVFFVKPYIPGLRFRFDPESDDSDFPRAPIDSSTHMKVRYDEECEEVISSKIFSFQVDLDENGDPLESSKTWVLTGYQLYPNPGGGSEPVEVQVSRGQSETSAIHQVEIEIMSPKVRDPYPEEFISDRAVKMFAAKGRKLISEAGQLANPAGFPVQPGVAFDLRIAFLVSPANQKLSQRLFMSDAFQAFYSQNALVELGTTTVPVGQSSNQIPWVLNYPYGLFDDMGTNDGGWGKGDYIHALIVNCDLDRDFQPDAFGDVVKPRPTQAEFLDITDPDLEVIKRALIVNGKEESFTRHIGNERKLSAARLTQSVAVSEYNLAHQGDCNSGFARSVQTLIEEPGSDDISTQTRVSRSITMKKRTTTYPCQGSSTFSEQVIGSWLLREEKHLEENEYVPVTVSNTADPNTFIIVSAETLTKESSKIVQVALSSDGVVFGSPQSRESITAELDLTTPYRIDIPGNYTVSYDELRPIKVKAIGGGWFDDSRTPRPFAWDATFSVDPLSGMGTTTEIHYMQTGGYAVKPPMGFIPVAISRNSQVPGLYRSDLSVNLLKTVRGQSSPVPVPVFAESAYSSQLNWLGSGIFSDATIYNYTGSEIIPDPNGGEAAWQNSTRPLTLQIDSMKDCEIDIGFAFGTTTQFLSRQIRLTDRLGPPASFDPAIPALSGYGTINTDNGNLFVSIPVVSHATPVMNPDVVMLYNSRDGLECGYGRGWRTNYDMRIYRAGRQFALIDLDSRRYVMGSHLAADPGRHSAMDIIWRQDQAHGLSATTDDWKDGEEYKLIRNDNRLYYFNAKGWLVRVRNLGGEELRITRNADGVAQNVKDFGPGGTTERRTVPLVPTSPTFTVLPSSSLASAKELKGLDSGLSGKWSFVYDGHGNMTEATISDAADSKFTHGSSSLSYKVIYDDLERAKEANNLTDTRFITKIDYPSDTVPNCKVTTELGVIATVMSSSVIKDGANITRVNTPTTSFVAKGKVDSPYYDKDHVRARRSFDYDTLGNLVSEVVDYLKDDQGVVHQQKTTWTYAPLVDQGKVVEGSNVLVETRVHAVAGLEGVGTADLVTTYRYETAKGPARGLLVHIVNADGTARTNSYTAQGFLEKSTDERGNTWTSSGHTLVGLPGLITAPQTDPPQPARSTAYVYSADHQGRIESIKDVQANLLTTFGYDSMNRQVSVDPPGVRPPQVSTFDPLGRITSQTGAEGEAAGDNDKVTFTYDAVGRQKRMHQPGATDLVTRYTVGSDENGPAWIAVQERDTAAISESVTDAAGRLSSTSVYRTLVGIGAITGGTTKCTSRVKYDPDFGFVESTTDARLKKTIYKPDLLGRAISITSTMGCKTTIVRNGLGWVLSAKNADGATASTTYSPTGQVRRQTNPAGGWVDLAYDPTGNLVRVAPLLGLATTTEFDAAGEATASVDIFGQRTTRKINAADKTVTVGLEGFPSTTVTATLNAQGFVGTVQAQGAAAVDIVRYHDGSVATQTAPIAGRATMRRDRDDQYRVRAVGPVNAGGTAIDPNFATVMTRNPVLGTVELTTDPRQRKVLAERNPVTGELNQVKDNANAPMADPGTLVQEVLERDENGNVLRYRTDPFWEVVQTFDPDNRLETRTVQGNRTHWYYQPQSSRLASIIFGQNDTTPLGTRIVYFLNYNDLGQVTAQQVSGRAVQTTTYGCDGTVLTRHDGVTTTTYRYASDTRQLTQVSDSSGKTTIFSYEDPRGRLTQRSDVRFNVVPGGGVAVDFGIVQYAYNDDARTVTLSYNDGRKEIKTHDVTGALVSIEERSATGAFARKKVLDRDQYGRLASTSYEVPNPANPGTTVTTVATIERDVAVAGFTRERQRYQGSEPIERVTDVRGRLTAFRLPGAEDVAVSYLGDRLQSRAGLDYVYYDSGIDTGRLWKIREAGADMATFTYRPGDGRVQTVALANGVKRTYEYDSAGAVSRLTQEAGGLHLIEDWTIARDGQGRITSVTAAGGQIDGFTYDLAGRLVEERRSTSPTVVERVVQYGYDGADNRTAQVVLPAPVSGLADFTAGMSEVLTDTTGKTGTWTVQGAALVADVASSARHPLTARPAGTVFGPTVSVAVTPAAPAAALNSASEAGIEVTADNGTTRYQAVWRQTRVSGFDPIQGQVVVIQVEGATRQDIAVGPPEGDDGSAATTLSVTVWPDARITVTAQRASVLTRVEAGTPGLTSIRSPQIPAALVASAGATFDDLRWSEVTGRTITTAVFDTFNRLNSQTERAEGVADRVVTFAYDDLGRQTGRTVGADTTGYIYDPLDRLTTITRNGNTTAGMTYFADSWLRSGLNEAGVATTWTYDDQRPLTSTTNGVTTRYAYHGSMPLWEREAGTSPILRVYGHDALGNVRGTITPLNGPSTTPGYDRAFTYDAFGSVTRTELGQFISGGSFSLTPMSNAAATTGPRAKGMWFDGGATNLYKTQTRSYAPELGRFTQVDPARAGMNWYAYADGDPVNKVDPTGLAAYFFDGTGNHPLAANLDGSANFKTNVRYLFDAYVGDAFYAYGIGTGYDPAGGVYSKNTLAEGVGIERQDSELATGGTMHERVNWMIQRLEGQLAKGDKNVEVFGFSRGSASAVEFLNRIQDKVGEGDPKYQGINVRFVGLFDGVSSMRENTLGGDSNAIVPRTIPGMAALSNPWRFWHTDSDGSRRQYEAVQYRFSLPRGLNYTNVPIHTVAMDEQRAEFQGMDVQGALQVGFRGVHSDVGGGYGPTNAFEWQPRAFMLQRAQAAGLQFDPLLVAKWPAPPLGGNFSPWWSSRDPRLQNSASPWDNSNWKYNDNEPRTMPAGLIIHQAGGWYSSPIKNAWTAPSYAFPGGALPPAAALQARHVLGVTP